MSAVFKPMGDLSMVQLGALVAALVDFRVKQRLGEIPFDAEPAEEGVRLLAAWLDPLPELRRLQMTVEGRSCVPFYSSAARSCGGGA